MQFAYVAHSRIGSHGAFSQTGEGSKREVAGWAKGRLGLDSVDWHPGEADSSDSHAERSSRPAREVV
jgi:hypothetical protein